MQPTTPPPDASVAPVAQTLDPLLVSWTRGILWITIIFSAIHFMRGTFLIIAQQREMMSLRSQGFIPVNTQWRMTPELLYFAFAAIGPQVLAMFAAKSCFRFRPRPRVALVIAMWLWIGLEFITNASDWPFTISWSLPRIANSLTLPVIVLLFFTRPVIRRLFDAGVERAFEPILPAPDATGDQHAA